MFVEQINKQVFAGLSYNKVSFDRIKWQLPSSLEGEQARLAGAKVRALEVLSVYALLSSSQNGFPSPCLPLCIFLMLLTPHTLNYPMTAQNPCLKPSPGLPIYAPKSPSLSSFFRSLLPHQCPCPARSQQPEKFYFYVLVSCFLSAPMSLHQTSIVNSHLPHHFLFATYLTRGILVGILQRNKRNKCIYRKRFIKGIGSHDSGGPEVPGSAVSKQRTQESQW